jgi:hypothetical protein
MEKRPVTSVSCSDIWRTFDPKIRILESFCPKKRSFGLQVDMFGPWRTSFEAIFSQTAKSQERQVSIAKLLRVVFAFLRSYTAWVARGRQLKWIVALHLGARNVLGAMSPKTTLGEFGQFFCAGRYRLGHLQSAGGQDSETENLAVTVNNGRQMQQAHTRPRN